MECNTFQEWTALKKPRRSYIITLILLFAALVILSNPPFVSGADENVIPEKETSSFDRIWSLATLYKNEGNPVLQKFAFSGRYQGQYYWVEGDTGEDHDWENRRLRLGFRGIFARQFSFRVEADFDTDSDPWYTGLTEAYVDWEPSEEFHLAVGKIMVRFTQEGSTSSNEILTFERSLLVTQVWPVPEYATGVSADGKLGGGRFLYRAGVFAGDKQQEFSNFDAGACYLGSVGYDFGKQTGLNRGIVNVDWFHNDGNPGNDAFQDYEDVVSLRSDSKLGNFGLLTDLIFAQGLRNVSDVWGFILLPSYDITKKLQAVIRYQHANSDGPDGLTAIKRYEQAAGGGTGDNYNAGYGGLNYYFYGHKFKLMTGVEYSKLKGGTNAGWNGWTVLAGVRMNW
jgi:phosphate-selective porin OprO/OprP